MLFEIVKSEVKADLQRNWFWILLLGICMVIVGAAAIGYPGLASLYGERVIGWLFIFAAIFQGGNSVFAKSWGGFFWELLVSILYLAAGILLLANPMQGVTWITFLIALVFVVEGTVKTVESVGMVGEGIPGSGWHFLSGLIGVMVGVFIFARWPASSLFVIGLFIGIAFLSNGIAAVITGLGAGISKHRENKAAA